MKNQIIKIVLVSLMVFCFFNTAHATLNVDTTVDVPTNCTVTATDDNTVHDYGSPSSYLAICALDAAVKNGTAISSVKLSNKYSDFGLLITAINDTASDSGHYWAIYQNENFADLGITSMPVAAGDTIVFQLTDSSNPAFPPPLDPTLDQVTLHINSLIVPPTPTTTSGGQVSGGGNFVSNTTSTSFTKTAVSLSTPPAKPTFDTNKAFAFLVAQQKDDGSFGESLYTDWSAMALASGDNQAQVLKLIKYLGENKIESDNLTDYERHAMALMTLGLNPYNTNGENYINKIITSFDGKQFGDTNQDNDDIFALLVLQNAGYTQADKIVDDDISFILSRQNIDGSWDNSVDMTGATMETLASFKNTDPLLTSPLAGGGEISNSLIKAENYLRQNQKDDGSWNENASSTAWAIEGILAQGEKTGDWIKKGNSPIDYLATIQDTDGGLPAQTGIKDENIQNKIWETAYVISALSGKTWNQTMQTFKKEDLPKAIVTTVKKTLAIAQTPKTTKPAIIIDNQNTTSVINAITPLSTTTQTEAPKKNWFMRLLSNIF